MLSGDGAHSIVAKDTDAAGNTGTSAPVEFTLDTLSADGCDQHRGGRPPGGGQTITGTVTAAPRGGGRATVTLFDTVSGVTTQSARRRWARRGLEHHRDAVGRRRPQHRGPGHRCRRQHRQQHAGVFTLDTVAPTVAISTAAGTPASRARRLPDGHAGAGEAAVGATVTLLGTVGGAHLRSAPRPSARSAVDHDRDAVGRWRPQHRGQGCRCGRQHRHQRARRVHARDGCPDGGDQHGRGQPPPSATPDDFRYRHRRQRREPRSEPP